MLKLRNVLLSLGFLFGLGQAKLESSFGHVYTSGYSSKALTWSFVAGHLDEGWTIESEENLTFLTFDDELSTLYAIHEVDNYEGFEHSGAISRWKVEADQDGFPTFTKLQVIHNSHFYNF